MPWATAKIYWDPKHDYILEEAAGEIGLATIWDKILNIYSRVNVYLAVWSGWLI